MTEVLGVDDFGPQTLSRCKDRTIPVADAVLQRYSDCDPDECLVDSNAVVKLQYRSVSSRLLHRGDDFPRGVVEIVGRDDGKPGLLFSLNSFQQTDEQT